MKNIKFIVVLLIFIIFVVIGIIYISAGKKTIQIFHPEGKDEERGEKPVFAQGCSCFKNHKQNKEQETLLKSGFVYVQDAFSNLIPAYYQIPGWRQA